MGISPPGRIPRRRGPGSELDLLAVGGDGTPPAELLLDRVPKGGGGRGLAVHAVGHRRWPSEAAKPSDDLRLVRVGRQGVRGHDGGAYGDVLAEDPELGGAVPELPAARAGRLIADEQHRRALVGQAMAEVMKDAASGGCGAAGNDDAGPVDAVQLPGVVARRAQMEARGNERPLALGLDARHVRVVLLGMT